MKINTGIEILALTFFCLSGCSKKNDTATNNPPAVKNISAKGITIDNIPAATDLYNIKTVPVIKIVFSEPVEKNSIAASAKITDNISGSIPYTSSLQNNDSLLVIQPVSPLKNLTKFNFSVTTSLKSASGGSLLLPVSKNFITQIDSAPKFPVLSDSALLDLVQQQTFKYFWDFAHPVSGLARERSNGDNEVVTTGGSGFGIMSIPVAIKRNFITREEGLARMQKMVGFLKNTAVKVKGAFPHWLNGTTGAIIPFSPNDDGADLVETAYLMAGLLSARQYFNDGGAAETNLRNDINALWNGVEWDWFRKGGQDVLYWHYSEGKQWVMNFPITGWNECLVTYILAAASPAHGVPASVYTHGWAGGSSFANGNTYFGYQLPLGPPQGGPLFFSHYSFLGVNPNGLQDVYANYTVQTKNHTLINYNYCKTNPGNNFGYSQDCWGLTASDIENGYNASSPTSDMGVIAPTAALSSFPYTPAESMQALKFFYYTLGDKIWKDYGFTDAFALKTPWFASSFLAIDQGPIIVMIENYRTGLIWNLLTGCPEVKAGMKALGFTAPYL